ncbi:MAG: monovalent cation/H(+) antiporter subunit G [Chloroflexales bacterium]|nr:monovalent cation/H(+) antiporter subunit G [Chloroflexales bacterium]
MSERIGDVLLVVGAVFLLLAGVGMLRMPDLFTRMQAATKASTLGIACVLLAVALHFASIGVTMRALAAMAFFLLTAPVTAHLIGRASYFVGTPLWERTVSDELRGHYNPFHRTRASAEDGPEGEAPQA